VEPRPLAAVDDDGIFQVFPVREREEELVWNGEGFRHRSALMGSSDGTMRVKTATVAEFASRKDAMNESLAEIDDALAAPNLL